MQRWLAHLILCAGSACAATFPFKVHEPAEVVVDLELSSPEPRWAALKLDGGAEQHILTYAGKDRYTYSAFLGECAAGEHRLEFDDAGIQVHGARFRQVTKSDPYWPLLAHAPILFARADTIGRLTDFPVISYGERLTENGRPLLQYTVIFSNEDGGTSTRALMARWGRTTDIEYIYRYWLDSGRATIQAKDHQEVNFRGRREGEHPILIPSTLNNMVSDEGESAVRYQIPPVLVDLTSHSREQVMDEHPIIYRIMAEELEREGKLRAFGTVEGEKISDPRDYLYVEAKVENTHSALAVRVRLKKEEIWRSSHLGRLDYAIFRSGWFRTTIELPPGTKPGEIAEIAFECLVAPEKPEPAAGVCRLETVSKAFFLGQDYEPQVSFWKMETPLQIPTGEMHRAVFNR